MAAKVALRPSVVVMAMAAPPLVAMSATEEMWTLQAAIPWQERVAL
jgi:hypothetical protein